MAYGDLYKVGTISVAANGTVVTGTGTSWATGASKLVKGDHISAAGQRAVIEAVGSDTALTMAIPWTGGALTNAAYVAEMDAASRNAAAGVSTLLQSFLDKQSRISNAGGRYTCVAVGLNTPPGSPAEGQMWVVGTAPTGAWTGYANYFAKWLGAAWQFWAPTAGDEAKDLTGGLVWLYNSAGVWNANSLQTGAVRYDVAQTLTTTQKTLGLGNLGLTISDFVKTIIDDADGAAVLTTLGATTIGKALFAAANATAAQTAIGATTVGTALIAAIDQAAGRTAIGAAASGANNDITSLSGLTTPISGAQGGNTPGTIIQYGGRTAPAGWLECDGAAVSRTTYSDLFAALTRVSTVTINIGTSTVTWLGHGLFAGDPVSFVTTGALPTGLVAGTIYYVAGPVATNTFQLASTAGGSALTMSGTQSGTHTATCAPWGDGNFTSTFNVPDLRGAFLRGWSHGASRDSGRVLGAYQADALQGHEHTQQLGGAITTAAPAGGSGVIGQAATAATLGIVTNGSNGAPRIASETRPINYAVMFCIKY